MWERRYRYDSEARSRLIVSVASGVVAAVGIGIGFIADRWGLPNIGSTANEVFEGVGTAFGVGGTVVLLASTLDEPYRAPSSNPSEIPNT